MKFPRVGGGTRNKPLDLECIHRVQISAASNSIITARNFMKILPEMDIGTRKSPKNFGGHLGSEDLCLTS